MSTRDAPDAGMGVDESIRTLLLLTPRMVGRAKRTPPPEELRSLNLAPRHLSLLAYLLFDGPLGVSEIAARLEVAPATVSLMVAELSRQGVVTRTEDDADRRRTIVAIDERRRAAVDGWLSNGARAWRVALEPLTPAERRTFVTTMEAYERELARADGGGG
ncbi:MarR family winged helix-turn-helix transcriptional regulator [Nocardiopsis mangrovi]|uniref:MarR family winged helix-turn-helix transcriptional regulator n=1 Tax=Nocardiopsis mangrovi TaxID=1179818 RepID=A0ABV9DWA0_9ACTN